MSHPSILDRRLLFVTGKGGVHSTAPAAASRSHGKSSPGSRLRAGAMSECAITRSGGICQRPMTSAKSRSSAAICRSGKGASPVFASSIPIEDEFTSVTAPQAPAPACQARISSGTSASATPPWEISQCAETSAAGSQSRARASSQVGIAV